jgi:hypothetical protein
MSPSHVERKLFQPVLRLFDRGGVAEQPGQSSGVDECRPLPGGYLPVPDGRGQPGQGPGRVDGVEDESFGPGGQLEGRGRLSGVVAVPAAHLIAAHGELSGGHRDAARFGGEARAYSAIKKRRPVKTANVVAMADSTRRNAAPAAMTTSF